MKSKKVLSWLAAVGITIFFVFAIKEKIEYPTEEIPCEIKRFEWVKDTDVYVEYKIKSKMVRQVKRFKCATDNDLNKEFIFSRAPVIIVTPFRPNVELPNMQKDIYLEE